MIKRMLLSVLMVAGYCFAETSRNEVTSPVPLSPTKLDVGGGLAIYKGSTGWSINTGLLKRWDENSRLYYGADIGLNFWSFTPVNTAATSGATAVQLLPSVVYYLDMTLPRRIQPYIGASIGPNVYISKTTNPGQPEVSNTQVMFEMLLRPGIAFNLATNVVLNVESKVGLLDSDLIFLPQANASIAL